MYTFHTSRTSTPPTPCPHRGSPFSRLPIWRGNGLVRRRWRSQKPKIQGSETTKKHQRPMFVIKKVFYWSFFGARFDLFVFFWGVFFSPRKKIVLPVTELMSYNEPNIATSMASWGSNPWVSTPQSMRSKNAKPQAVWKPGCLGLWCFFLILKMRILVV